MQNCPCGSSQAFDNCCAPFLNGQATPDTPEKLMRSRYSAYAMQNINYVSDTMKSPANDDFDPEEALRWSKKSKWLGLEVLNTSQNKNKGSVEFIAHYSQDNKHYKLHEISEFQCEDGRWYYVDGSHPVNQAVRENKLGRNDPCHCGSNKKYKKCCGKN